MALIWDTQLTEIIQSHTRSIMAVNDTLMNHNKSFDLLTSLIESQDRQIEKLRERIKELENTISRGYQI